MIRIAALDTALVTKWARLFEASSSSCFCRFWHFTGTKNDWLARCAFEPDANRKEQEAALASADPSAEGLVAIDDAIDQIVGWMKLAPRRSLTKLRTQSVYRAHDLGSDDGVYGVGCFLVDPAHRHRGVARALLAAAPEFVRAKGGRIVEAYPRQAREALHDEEAWMGPEALFLEHGFTAVAGESPYPVFQKRVS